MTTAWGVSWLLEPAIKAGHRVIFVTDESDESIALQSYEPPGLFGIKATRLGPGVFEYKSGATLQVWSYSRHVSNLPNVSKPFHVVLDPAVLSPGLAPMAMTIGYVVRWGLTEVSTQEMGLSCTATTGIANSDFSFGARAKVSIEAIRSKGSSHLTMPYVCGHAAGMLLDSKVGKWLAMPAPAKVVLRDALGRAFTMDDVMPVLEITATGKKFRLCAEVSSEIRFTETHG